MIHTSKQTDEKREVSGARLKATDESYQALECWLLHGSVGMASDWRSLASALAAQGIASRAVDLWRFLEFESVSMPDFGKRLNADAEGEISRGQKRILIGYSMGGRLALHSLLEGGPWHAAVIISADPGLRDTETAAVRRSQDTLWATQALTLPWAHFLEKWNSQPILGSPIRDEREENKLIRRRREIARSFVDWSLGNQRALWDRLPEIQIPTLWIAGENDAKFRALAEEAAAAGSISLAIAPGCGHRIPWENEAWLTERIADFTSSLP